MNTFNKSITKQALALLPNQAPKKLSLLIAFQLVISTLDIFAILLLGYAAKSGLDYSQGKLTKLPDSLVKTLKISEFGYISQVGLLAAFIIVLFVLRTLVSLFGYKRIFLYLANQASLASKNIVEKTFSTKPQFMINRNSQEFLYGITQGIDNLTLMYLGSIIILFTESIFLMFMFGVLFLIEPVTGFMTVAIFGLASIGIHKITSGKTKVIASEFSDLTVLYSKRLLDTLLVYRELVLRQKQISVIQELQSTRTRSLRLRALLLFLPNLSKYLFELVLVVGGSFIAFIQLVFSDVTTAISSVAVFLAAASRVLPSLIRVQGALISLRQSEGSSEITVHHLNDLENQQLVNSPILKNAEQTDGNIEFIPSLKIENLTFAYDEDSSFRLENISLNVKAGQFVAIVGESGSGKTTLIDLVLGMLNPNSGSVEISRLSPVEAIRRWPGKISYVPQDVAIIDGDIRRNITLEEDLERSEAEILDALEKAHLKNEVLAMPNGLSQLVGERGFRLSGGQRQRLGIARALYTQPEMIIFDEATSSLDPVTENTVTNAIYGKIGEVTLIVVAHRLSTVKNADLVVLIDKGKLIAQGTFEEVRSISPKFDEQAKLVNL